MNEQEIKEWLTELATINQSDLSGDLDRSIQYQAEIIESIFLINDKLIKAKSRQKKITRDRYMKYICGNTGDPAIDNIKYSRSELEEILAGDEMILDSKDKVEKFNNLLDLYNKALDMIKAKNFNIKHIIDYRKYMNGEMG